MTEELINGQIYKIFSESSDLVYIGSTRRTLNQRLACHKRSYLKWLNGDYYYITSFDIFKMGNVKIELIENVICDNVKELHKREGEIIRQTKNCVNQHIAGRTRQEYYQENKDKLKDKHAKYYEANKDKLKDKHSKYYEANKDKLNENHRIYYAQYYQDNKEKLNQKINCECGGKYTHAHKARHFKSKKHQAFLAQQKN